MIGVQLPWVVSAVAEVGNPERDDHRNVGRAPVKSSKIVVLQGGDDDSAGTARFPRRSAECRDKAILVAGDAESMFGSS